MTEGPLSPEELATPLAAPIESTGKHDPYINKRFIALMDGLEGEEFTPEMPDYERAISMTLATNDPERKDTKPVSDTKDKGGSLELSRARGSNDPQDAMVGRDVDGDTLNVAYSRTKSAIFIKTTPTGYYLPIGKVPGLVNWLLSRKAKHEGRGEVSA